MELNDFLKSYFNQLSTKNICEKNNFENYENFKEFIITHYHIKHVEIFNYIKYVKIKRQIIKLREESVYISYIDRINKIIIAMSDVNTFPNINIRKYLCRINAVFKLMEDKKKCLLDAIYNLRTILNMRSDYDFKIKITNSINGILYRYKIFLQNCKKLKILLNDFMKFESTYGIDHNLIKLNNSERCILGKKSEYTANKIINEYVNMMNDKGGDKKYYYETNINFLKLLNIDIYHENNIKGEVDGMIISYDGKNYIIEKIIEVKSSIKSTFEDIKKFLFLQEYINNLTFDENIKYYNYIFTKESFINITNENIAKWTLYLCVNNIYKDRIEKSHLYFSNVLKIVDEKFIEDYYINNNDESIKKKFKIIVNNRELIDNLFKTWEKNIMLDTNDCNIFISKLL